MTNQNTPQQHWEKLFSKVDTTQVLWHQSSPDKSLELIMKHAKTDAAIIDVGCGTSLLVDSLLHEGYKDITLLDISKTSLETVKKRVQNNTLTTICSDLLAFKSEKKFSLWHDRAVFHFLTQKEDRLRYFEVLSESLERGATVIISTFHIDGPTQCAGLDIVQYDVEKMQEELPRGLEITAHEAYTHITPKKTEQAYIYFTLKKI